MATTLSFAIVVTGSSGGATVTQPVQCDNFIAVAPWGQGTSKPDIESAINDLLHRGGSQYSGAFSTFMSAQTLNGATSTSPPTAYTSANQL